MTAAARIDGPIYLDHAAATTLRPEVDDAMREAARVAFANASSPHALGRRARQQLEEARERIIAACGGRSSGPQRDRLVFTSGATEANRLGVLGRGGPAGVIAWSARDHASVATAAEELVRRGWRPHDLAVDSRGSVAAAATSLASALPAGTVAVVCLTTACGQTGTVDPPAAALAGHSRIALHIDHAQAFAWSEPPLRDTPAATLTVTPHKFGGPKGIGGLLITWAAAPEPVQPGPQELGLRGGTEAVPLAIGFAVAAEAAAAERATAVATVTRLRDRLERGILAAATAAGHHGLIVGHDAPRVPHITTIAIAGIDRQTLVMAADLSGVCLATGTACASGSSEPSAAVESLGLPGWVSQSAVRASLSPATTDADVDEAVRRMAVVFRGIAGGGLQRTANSR